ncbi:UDP-N-acetylmuramate:L-alanyl-gamma-D-glutamyl-meso-diaminopimelate ligase [Bdellovibrio sp. qaytius]|nr:UDP-N-acetylmuramate:L-alanyl-gamma-D-glutamyl-meso-diaminopimelate ligase [Bdellovibrio sp. qaytius]
MSQSSLKNIKTGSHVHLMGICGTAMASLAGLLKDKGYKVTGSDSNPYPPMSTQLESLGIQIQKPYSKNNLNPKPDFVIVGNVISASNEEAREMVRLEIPYCSLPQAMGEFIIDDRISYVISGTHGKTTTTSLMSWVLDQAGFDPGFLIGGIAKNFSQSFRNPKQNVFVIEGDEYDTAYFDKVPKFIHYRPKNVILTSVEFDHADIYKDFAAVKAAFITLMKLIPENGNFVYWGDDANVCEVATHCKIKNKFSYGFESKNDFVCKIVEETEGYTKFSIYHNSEKLADFVTTMTGRYNILNASAVVAQAFANKLPLDGVMKGLSTFAGVKRRQDILGEPGGILVIEDFAHHPTAVKETVLAIQNKYKSRKVFSVFEPRSATSRRKVFQKDYVDAFSEGHEVIIAEAFDQGKISEEDRFSSAELVADLKKKNKTAHVMASADEIVKYLKETAKPKDVILIMSNGGFDGIYQKLFTALE